MKTRRLLPLLLVISMLLLLISGCGESAGSSTTASNTPEETAAASEPSPASEEAQEPEADVSAVEESAVEQMPSAEEAAPEYGSLNTDTKIKRITDEPVTLSMFITFPTEYLNYTGGYAENEAYLTMAEKTGVTIDFYQVPSGDSGTEYSLLIAGGDYTDFIGGSQTDYENEITIELSDLIDEYMPNYNAVLQSNLAYERAATTDANEHVGI